MKRTSNLNQLKGTLKKRKNAERANTNSTARVRFATSTAILVGLCLILAGVGTLAVRDFLAKVPLELIGLWEIVEGPQLGSTFEFFRDGRMEMHLSTKGKSLTHKARVAVRDKALTITAKEHLPRQETSESTIRELTADTLILEEKGTVLKLVRIE